MPIPSSPRRLLLAATLVLGALAAGCGPDAASGALVVPGGEPARGRALIDAYGCGSCHTVPGVPGANTMVGPPLTGWSARKYIAGNLLNEPGNLVRWVRDPQAVEPGTVMPDLGVSEKDARDIAAYLYSLDDPTRLGPPHPFPARWLRALMPEGGGARR